MPETAPSNNNNLIKVVPGVAPSGDMGPSRAPRSVNGSDVNPLRVLGKPEVGGTGYDEYTEALHEQAEGGAAALAALDGLLAASLEGKTKIPDQTETSLPPPLPFDGAPQISE